MPMCATSGNDRRRMDSAPCQLLAFRKLWCMSTEELDLQHAMIGAAEAPPMLRIDFRDAIARHGDDGVHAVEPWLADDEMRRFAVRVVVRAVELGAAVDAATVLQRALAKTDSPDAIDELRWGLDTLGVRRRALSTQAKGRRPSIEPVTRDRLAPGKKYNRRELHAAGWGGNWQSGVSYPAEGDHVLLFSDPAAAHDHGYRDGWDGTHHYQYFGAWSGTGDMTLSAVNQTILDRSPNLHLLIRDGSGWRYEGEFVCLGYEQQRTTRDGAEYQALVFRLERSGVGS